MHNGFLIAGLALAAAVILGFTYYFRTYEEVRTPVAVESIAVPVTEPAVGVDDSIHEEAAPPAAVMEETPASPAVVEEPALLLPGLNESDDLVRQRLVGSLLPEAWINRDDLLRRLAVVIENANRGELPRRQLEFLTPSGKYRVREVGEGEDRRLFVDPESYARYDHYLNMLESVAPETLAALFVDTYPLLDEALLELGDSESASPQVLASIDQILALPILRGDIELVQPKVFFEYADPALEGLTPLQKQVLRMGPDNVSRLQTYVVSLRNGLIRR